MAGHETTFKVEFEGGKEGLEGIVDLALSGNAGEYVIGGMEAASPLTEAKATVTVNANGAYRLHAALMKEREDVPKEIKLKPFEEAGFRIHGKKRRVSRTTFGSATAALFSPQLPRHSFIYLSVAENEAVTLDLRINPNGLTRQDVGKTVSEFRRAMAITGGEIYRTVGKQAPQQALYLGPGERVQRIQIERPVGSYGNEAAVRNEQAKPAMATQQDLGEKITLEDLGGLNEQARKTINLVLLACSQPELLTIYGAEPLRGVLFVGQPGTGKTSIGRAIANQSGLNFWYLNMAKIDSEYYTKREQNLADFLEEIKKGGRGILYIDELQSVTPHREGAHEATGRFVDTLNQYMDGFQSMRGIILMAASNFKEAIDKATLSRFNYIVEVPLPDVQGRGEIIKIHLRKAQGRTNRPLFADGLDVSEVAEATPGYSGRDLATLVNRTCIDRLIGERLDDQQVRQVNTQDFLTQKVMYDAEKKSGPKGEIGFGRHAAP